MTSLRIPAVLGFAALVTAVVFYLAPAIDLTVAEAFYVGRNRFAGQTPLGEMARRLAYWVPTAAFVASIAVHLARRLGLWRGRAPTGRAAVVLGLSFAIGPGLLANTVLKDHSHRPRPYQTVNFGGDDAFRPFYTFDGACVRNCSFVSGEGAAAFWTIAPALMLLPPLRGAVVAGSLVFAVAVGTLRMSFGGHYLSDTIFAALLTWSVIWLAWRMVLGRRRPWMSRASVRPNEVQTSATENDLGVLEPGSSGAESPHGR